MNRFMSLIATLCIASAANAQVIKLYNGDKLVKTYTSSEVTDIVFEKAQESYSKYYITGNPNGWNSTPNTMFYCLGDGRFSYTTYFKGAWDVKFWEEKYLGDWTNIWGAGNGDGAASGNLVFGSDAGAFQAPSAGYWTLTLNMVDDTYTWTSVKEGTTYNTVSIIGDFNNWQNDGEIDMTQISPENGDIHNWYGEVKLKSTSTLKFRANHAWDVSWGSKEGTVVSDSVYYGETGDEAITVPAGTYKCYLNDITGQWSIVDEYAGKAAETIPTDMYLVGSCIIGNGSGRKAFAPVYGMEGEFYTLVYSDGASHSQLHCYTKDNKVVGYDDIAQVNDNANSGIKKVGDYEENYELTNPGWYLVYLTSSVVGKQVEYTLNIEKAEAGVVGEAFGGWDCITMTTPASNTEWETPAATAAGEMRAYVKVPGRDWWRTEFTIHSGSLYFRTVDIPNSWAENIGADYSVQLSAGQKVKINFDANTASVE